MPPLTTAPLLRLDPAFPPLWRDGETVQFGRDGDVRVRVDHPWVEPLIAALRSGIRPNSFDVVAHGLGAGRHEARRLLDALRPVLERAPSTLPAVWVDAVNLVDSRPEAWMRAALDEGGAPVAERGQTGATAVVLLQGAAATMHVAEYLRADVPHLPVAFEVDGITIGPWVVPGRTPCLACRDGHERDRDPAWPLLHSQLIGRSGTACTPAGVAEAAGMALRLLNASAAGDAHADDHGAAQAAPLVRLTGNGRRVWRSVRFHEECRCRESSFRSRQGIARAPVPLAPHDWRHGPKRATGFARLA